MKKLAIVLLVVAAGCSRKVAVGTGTAPDAAGAGSPREAVEKFLAAAKAQDVQGFSMVWGSTAGPAISTIDRDEREMRVITLMCYLKHDSYQILGEAPAKDAERVLAVESKYRDLTRSTNFYATRGPQSRWFVRHFEAEPLTDMCARR